jgi:spermidine/putrescine transport system permease protein
LVPLLSIVGYSFFKTGDYGRIIYSWQLDNYQQLMRYTYLRIFGRSLVWSVITLVLTFLLAYPVAYWLAFHVSDKRKNLLLFLLLMPSWTTYILRIYSWMFMMRNSGLINEILIGLHIIDEPLKLLYTPTAVIIGMVYSWFYLMLLPLYASLEKLDHSVLEAAADLGARPLVSFIKVTLPLTKGGILSGSLLVGIPAIGAYVVPELLGGGKHVMVGSAVATLFLEFSNWPLASSLALILMVVMLIATVIYMKIAGKGAMERLF